MYKRMSNRVSKKFSKKWSCDRLYFNNAFSWNQVFENFKPLKNRKQFSQSPSLSNSSPSTIPVVNSFFSFVLNHTHTHTPTKPYTLTHISFSPFAPHGGPRDQLPEDGPLRYSLSVDLLRSSRASYQRSRKRYVSFIHSSSLNLCVLFYSHSAVVRFKCVKFETMFILR